MLTAIELATDDPAAAAHAADDLRREFPALSIRRAPVAADDDVRVDGRQVTVPVRRWLAPALDLYDLDRTVAVALRTAGPFTLRVVDDGRGALRLAALQIVTRCQRHLPGGNAHSATDLFARVREAHRRLHDLGKPLVAADHDHALDTWRWTLRLDRRATAAVQMAALLHDVERLVSEADVRVEQHTGDYAAFKAAHARAGAEMARAVLERAGAGAALAARVADLVAQHERPGADPERMLLNEADALSFFSLNAPGFLAYYGSAHTARKVAYTLARLTPRAQARLGSIRMPPEVQALVGRKVA